MAGLGGWGSRRTNGPIEMANHPPTDSEIEQLHSPVMLERCIELLSPALGGERSILVDATLGMAGHSIRLLELFPKLRLVGIDRDPKALEIARVRLRDFADRTHFACVTYDRIPEALSEFNFKSADGILFDLGVSSLQLDDSDRGFSYSREAALDMRMNQSDGPTAANVLAEFDETALTKIFWKFGEERFASRIAKFIVAARTKRPIATSSQLVELVEAAVPASARRAGHPAKRVFQALRIEVNQELRVLEDALPAAIGVLSKLGRLVVMSYHSLEDRIVKQTFAAATESSSPKGLPVELPGHEPKLRLLTRGAEKASEREISENPRSASVRLRAVERTRVAA